MSIPDNNAITHYRHTNQSSYCQDQCSPVPHATSVSDAAWPHCCPVAQAPPCAPIQPTLDLTLFSVWPSATIGVWHLHCPNLQHSSRCPLLFLIQIQSDPTMRSPLSMKLLGALRALPRDLSHQQRWPIPVRHLKHWDWKLFVLCGNPNKGLKVSPQKFSKWVTSAFHLCIGLASQPPPTYIKAHSNRAVLSSIVFLAGMSLSDVCATATRSTPSTFVSQFGYIVMPPLAKWSWSPIFNWCCLVFIIK